MKKIFLFCLFAVCAFISGAQTATTLGENFNTSCASTSGFPIYWMRYDAITGSNAPDSGSWTCSANGRYGTPGMECTGDYSGNYNLDSALLLTPGLDLSGFPGNVYLQFDTKATFVSGERLAVIATPTYSAIPTYVLDTDALIMTPLIGPGDSTGWVTHQVDLTPFKSSIFFVAFMYTSSTTYGTKWFLDNVDITPWPLGITDITELKIPLAVIGNATASEVRLSYNIPIAGVYNMALYDMMGRDIYKSDLNTDTGQRSYTISGLDLPPGMYCIKLGNGTSYGIVKFVVQ